MLTEPEMREIASRSASYGFPFMCKDLGDYVVYFIKSYGELDVFDPFVAVFKDDGLCKSYSPAYDNGKYFGAPIIWEATVAQNLDREGGLING